MTMMAPGSCSLMRLSASIPSMPAIFTSRKTRSGFHRSYSVMPSTALPTARTSYPSNSSSCPSAARIPCSSSMIRMRRGLITYHSSLRRGARSVGVVSSTLAHVLVQGDPAVRHPNVAYVWGERQRQRVIVHPGRARAVPEPPDQRRDHAARNADASHLHVLHLKLAQPWMHHAKCTRELHSLPIAEYPERAECAGAAQVGQFDVRAHRELIAAHERLNAIRGRRQLPRQLAKYE